MKVPRWGRSLTYGHPQQTTHLPRSSTLSRMEFAFCLPGCDKCLRRIVSATLSLNALAKLRYPSAVVQALDYATSLLKNQQPSKKQHQACEIVGCEKEQRESIRLPRICQEPAAMMNGRGEARMAPDNMNIPPGFRASGQRTQPAKPITLPIISGHPRKACIIDQSHWHPAPL